MGDGFLWVKRPNQQSQSTEGRQHAREERAHPTYWDNSLLYLHLFTTKAEKNETINSTKLNTKYLAAVHYHTALLKIVKSVVQIAIL